MFLSLQNVNAFVESYVNLKPTENNLDTCYLQNLNRMKEYILTQQILAMSNFIQFELTYQWLDFFRSPDLMDHECVLIPRFP